MTLSRDGQLLFSTRVRYDAFVRTVNDLSRKEATGVLTAAPAGSVSAGDISNWNTAFGWGDHGAVGYLTTEVDPVFAASAAAGIAGADITNWNAAFGWGNHALAGYLTSFTESDPVFSASVAASITLPDVVAWDTAVSWGDHALAGYLTSFTESDPVFAASVAAGIAALDVTNWNTAFGWGNHALAGYLTSFTETDPVFTASPAAGIAGADIANWNTAFGWGDHAAGGYAQDSVVVKLSGDQTVAGVKTFSSAPRVHRTDAEMLELWHTDASANTGRWRFDVAADGKLTLQGLTDAGAAGQLAIDISRSGSNVPAVNLYANGLVTQATQQYNTGDATTGAVVRHRNGGFYDVGMNVMPITDLTGADLTLGPQHCGGLIRKWDTSARNINIPASSDTTIPIGARFEYAGWNPGAVTLVGGSGVSISWLTGAGITVGNRTFSQGAAVTIVRTDASRWFVWGTGIS